jgi:diacylglycerol kinase (ATP)
VKACVILNPKAGSVTDLPALLKQIEKLNPGAIHLSRKKGGATALAKEAVLQGYKYIIAAGGDGTLNEIVNGVATRAAGVRVGLLPLGTGNDFARSLNLPAEIEQNIAVLKAARTRPIDLVRVRSDRVRYFINVSAGGFSGLVNEKLTPKIKRAWGPLAYVRSAAAAFPQLRAYKTTVRLGSKKPFSSELYNVIIANGRYVAGGLPIAPRAHLADGLLDIVLIPAHPMAEIVLLAAQMVLGKHLRKRAVIFKRAARVSIRSSPGMWFNVDGELVGNDPATFEVMPRALNFVVRKK